MKNKKNLKIHFVCSGNLFRSRLAEAYLRSKVPSISVSSSGTKSSLQNKGSIVWYTQRILYRQNLLSFMKMMWSDTTKNELKNAHLVVFFGKKNYDFCREKFKFSGDHLIWEVSDFDDIQLNGKPTDITEEIKYLRLSEDVFAQIKEKVDNLVIDRGLA